MSNDMLRAPLSLAKMSYDAATGAVIYRSKMHAGLKRNFQVMSGAAWLEVLNEVSVTLSRRALRARSKSYTDPNYS